MAAIEDLIKQVADPGLREQLAAEVARLKATKKFGLVFEEHLPELVRLPGLPVRNGVRVVKKDGNRATTYRVLSTINGQRIKIAPEAGGAEEIVERRSVVVAKAFGEPMYPALVPVDAVERAPGKPWHVLINADNYHALQLLLYGYEGKVDVIYIDPPYNSGARDWKYNNNFVDKTDQYRHSKWLSMMKRRLILAKRLLRTSEAVLIVTIDENEYLRLGLLLEQLFAGSIQQMVSITINPKGTHRPREFSRVDEFAFFVLLGSAGVPSVELGGGATEIRWPYLRRSDAGSVRGTRPRQFYPIFVEEKSMQIMGVGPPLKIDDPIKSVTPPFGCKAVFPINDDGVHMEWGLTGPSLMRAVEEGFVRVTPGRNAHQAFTIAYLTRPSINKIKTGELVVTGTRDDGSKIVVIPAGKAVRRTTTWREKSHDAGAYGTSLLGALLPGRRFPYPKSLHAVEDCLGLFLKNKPDALVLDFFAGSGTTGHAVMRLNKQDNGRRRSILVSNNEVSSEEEGTLAEKGLQPGNEQWEACGIFEMILWPRIKAAITGSTSDGGTMEGVYKFPDEVPMKIGFEENAAYFKLGFLDPADVTRGEKFESIVPILWMLADCRGACELSKGVGKWVIPKANPFAVLLKEDAFAEFQAKLAKRPDIDHVFLVTDSTEAFHEMAAELGRGYKSIQLYRSYIDTFRINLTEPGTITPGGVPAIPYSVAPLAPLAQEVAGAV